MRRKIPDSHPLEEIRVRQLKEGIKFLNSLPPELRRAVAEECADGEAELELRQRHGAWTVAGSVPEFRWFRAAWVVAIASSLVAAEMHRRDAARATVTSRLIAIVWGGGVHSYVELDAIAKALREETALPWARAHEVWAAYVQALHDGVITPPNLKLGRSFTAGTVVVLRS